MHLKCAKMLVIVAHENMKLRVNTLNNERLHLKTKISDDISIILKPKGHIKGRLISKILIFLKNLSSGLKIIR